MPLFNAVGGSSAPRATYEYEILKWTQTTLPTSATTWYSVTYGNGKFVAIAGNSNI